MTTKKKLLSLLKKKGLSVNYIEYKRGCPTPDGFADGWSARLDNKSERMCLSITYDFEYEFNGYRNEGIIEWIDSLPDCSNL